MQQKSPTNCATPPTGVAISVVSNQKKEQFPLPLRLLLPVSDCCQWHLSVRHYLGAAASCPVGTGMRTTTVHVCAGCLN